MFKSHGIIRLYIDGHIHCPVCLKLFWTRARLLNHLKYRSKVCKLNLVLRGTRVSEDEARIQDSAVAEDNASLYNRGRRNHFACDPVLQLCGPVHPIILPDELNIGCHHRLGFGHNYNR